MSTETAPRPHTRPQLSVALQHRAGSLAVDVTFSVTQPWTILFGPSGSGKTTILRAIAGLIRPCTGTIGVTRAGAGADLLVDTRARLFLPPHQRHIPLAAQSAALFPHLRVREQLAYGMSVVGPESALKDDRAREIDQVISLFRLRDLADKLPRTLSGGEAQRVNLARAAASATSVLLLDEPFTGVDAALRSELLLDLQTWARERNLCVLSVTHDLAEAFQLGAEVIKLREGKVGAQGPVDQVLAQERLVLLRQLGAREHFPGSSEPFVSG